MNLTVILFFFFYICLSMGLSQEREYEWKQIESVKITGLPNEKMLRTVGMHTIINIADSMIGFCTVEYSNVPQPVRQPTICSSHDSGKTWRFVRADFDSGSLVTAIKVSENQIYWHGLYPLHYNTTNNGKDWVRLPWDSLPPNKRTINFDSNFGICSRFYFYDLYLTEDGGKNWKKVRQHDSTSSNPDTLYSQYEAFVIDSNHYFVNRWNRFSTDWKSTFSVSSDRCKTWRTIPIILDGISIDSSNHFRVTLVKKVFDNIVLGFGIKKFVDASKIAQTTIIISRDYGLTWTTVDSEPYTDSTLDLLELHKLNDSSLVAQYYRGQAKISYDFGTTWTWLVKDRPTIKKGNKSEVSTWLFSSSICNLEKSVAIFANYSTTPLLYRLQPKSIVDVQEIESGINTSINNMPIYVSRLSPCPANAYLTSTVFLANGLNKSKVQVQVYSLLGERVISKNLEALSISNNGAGDNWYDISLPLDEVSNGVYVIRVSDESFAHTKLFVVNGK